jgi:hypothetical protein
MIIAPHSKFNLASTSRYFNVLTASRAFQISSVHQGLEKTTVKSGHSYDLNGVDIIDIHNDGNDDLVVEFEVSELKTVSGSNSGIEIVNAPTIKKIVEPITAHTKSVNPVTLQTAIDIVLAPGERKKLVDASVSRYEFLIQNISGTRTFVRVGDDSVSAVKGLIVVGSRNAPATMSLNCGGAVYAYNDSGQQAILSILEVSQ